MKRIAITLVILFWAATASATFLQYDFKFNGILVNENYDEIGEKIFGGTAIMYYDDNQLISRTSNSFNIPILEFSLDVDGTILRGDGSMRFGSNDGTLSLFFVEDSFTFGVMDGPYYVNETYESNTDAYSYELIPPMDFSGGLLQRTNSGGNGSSAPNWFTDYIDIDPSWGASSIGFYTVESNFSNGRELQLAPIPEPSTILLFGIGIIGLAVLMKKNYVNTNQKNYIHNPCT